jgi:hypothetical protein
VGAGLGSGEVLFRSLPLDRRGERLTSRQAYAFGANVRFRPIADIQNNARLPRVSEAGPKPIILPLSTVAAYLFVAVSSVLALSYFFDWVAERFDWSFLTTGRRMDLASLLAILLGLLITRLVGRWILPEPPTKSDPRSK